MNATKVIAAYASGTRARCRFHINSGRWSKLVHNFAKSSPLCGAGCGSPMARGAKPLPARYAAFSILSTSYGGSNGRAQALPVTLRVPRSSTPVRAAARCGSWSAVVPQGTTGASTMTTISRETASRINPLISSIGTNDTISICAQLVRALGFAMEGADPDIALSMCRITGAISAAMEFEIGGAA